MDKPTLYPAQQRGVDLYFDLPAPRRFIFPWKTGCGKTAVSLQILCRKLEHLLEPPRTLIVCPAVVRNHWYREIGKWVGKIALDRAAEITVGQERKLASKKARLRRDAAYCASIQIVSYDLLGEVRPDAWQFIIIDELHHCAQPRSKQSRFVRALLAANPAADVLGLSATLIPTEAKQLWNPLRIIFGEQEWGKPSKTGDVSWNFVYRYCNVQKNEYGCMPFGVNQRNVNELRTRLQKITYPLSREDIVSNMPPLDVKVQQFCFVKSQAKLVAQIVDWHEQFDADDVRKRVILVRHRELAKDILKAIDAVTDAPTVYLDGSILPAKRAQALQICEGIADRVVLIGTHEALSEGIRLMWAQQVMIAEWSQSPGRVMQLLGRFNSVGSQARPQVTIHSTDKTFAAARQLIRRTEDVMAALGTSPREKEIRDIFGAAGELGTIDPNEWGEMFDSHIPDEWSDDEAERE